MFDPTFELDHSPASPLESTPGPWRFAASRASHLKIGLRAAAGSEGPLGEAAAYHLRHLGKLLRGRLALASADAVGADPDDALQLAIACELLHNASLVHDDLQDRDAVRRDRPTVWKRFGDAMAVNVGDHLLTCAFEQAARVDGSLVGRFADAVHQTLVGQTWDVLAVGSDGVSYSEYETLARSKTGPLLALPVEGVLGLVNDDLLARSAVRDAMGALGLAYQIQDDLLDLFGLKDRPEAAADVRRGRPNAVVAKYADAADEAERAALAAYLRGEPGSQRDPGEWARTLRISPAVEEALEACDAARAEAAGRISALPPSLRELLDFAASRLMRPLRHLRPLSLRVENRSPLRYS